MTEEYRYTLNGKRRQDAGKGASRRLRREGWVPAIVYGADEEALSIAIKQDELIKNARFDSFYSQVINLKIEGEEDTEVLVRDVQHHLYKPMYQHFDFQRIVRGQDVNSTVVLEFINEEKCPGVVAGGIVARSFSSVEIVCRPRFLPEYIEVDMAEMELGDILNLSDLVLPEGVRLQQEEDLDLTPVVQIMHPRAEEEELDEDLEEAVEGEEAEDEAEDGESDDE